MEQNNSTALPLKLPQGDHKEVLKSKPKLQGDPSPTDQNAVIQQ